jgi:hypothetical protein
MQFHFSEVFYLVQKLGLLWLPGMSVSKSKHYEQNKSSGTKSTFPFQLEKMVGSSGL